MCQPGSMVKWTSTHAVSAAAIDGVSAARSTRTSSCGFGGSFAHAAEPAVEAIAKAMTRAIRRIKAGLISSPYVPADATYHLKWGAPRAHPDHHFVRLPSDAKG